MLFAAALALIEPGDEVLTPDPGFPIYESVVRFAGGRPVYYPLHESRAFALDVAALAERITPRSRAIIVNLPHNPTGGIATPDELARLAALAQRHDLWGMADAAYGPIRYGDAFGSGEAPDVTADRT